MLVLTGLQHIWSLYIFMTHFLSTDSAGSSFSNVYPRHWFDTCTQWKPSSWESHTQIPCSNLRSDTVSSHYGWYADLTRSLHVFYFLSFHFHISHLSFSKSSSKRALPTVVFGCPDACLLVPLEFPMELKDVIAICLVQHIESQYFSTYNVITSQFLCHLGLFSYRISKPSKQNLCFKY